MLLHMLLYCMSYFIPEQFCLFNRSPSYHFFPLIHIVFSAKVRRTGMRLAKLLQGDPFSQINPAKPKQNVTNAEVQLLAIRRMLLYDYIDENVHSILSSSSSSRSSSSKAADIPPVVSSKDSLLNFAISCMYRSLESSQSQRAPTGGSGLHHRNE